MRKLVSLIAALILATSAIGAVPAAATSPWPYVRIYEDINNGGDTFKFNTFVPGINYPDLYYLTTGLTPSCNKNGYANPHWDNCISSIKLYIANTNTCLQFWSGTNYTGSLLVYWGGDNWPDGYRINMGSFWNDNIASMRYGNSSTGAGCYQWH